VPRRESANSLNWFLFMHSIWRLWAWDKSGRKDIKKPHALKLWRVWA